MKETLEQTGFPVTGAAVEYVANAPIEVSDEDLEKCATLVEALEEYDDVTNVYTNLSE